MNKDQRNVIRVFRPTFTKDVDQVDDLMDLLASQDVLADDTIEKIRETEGRRKQAGLILDHLVRRPPSAFDKFYSCLVESCNEHLADKLKPECAPARRSTKPRNTSAPGRTLSKPVQPRDEAEKHGNVGLSFPEAVVSESSLIEDEELPERWPDPNRSIFDLIIKEVEAANMKELFEHQNSTEFSGYKMTSNPRGRAVIVNNTRFLRSEPRIGNDADVFALDKILAPLRFTIVKWNNFTKQKLLAELKSESDREEHWNTSAFMLIILSHGVHGAIKTVDEQDVTIEEIMTFFNRDNCPALIGKPKMFFVQACQGTTQDSGNQTDSDEGNFTTGVENIQIPQQQEDMTDAGAEKVPLFSDIIIVNATTPNFVSWRNENGTWFIQAIVDVFAKCAHKEHLGDLLIRVKNLVSRGQTQVKGRVQIANVSFDTLRHKVYFFPGLPPAPASGNSGNLLLDL